MKEAGFSSCLERLTSYLIVVWNVNWRNIVSSNSPAELSVGVPGQPLQTLLSMLSNDMQEFGLV